MTTIPMIHESACVHFLGKQHELEAQIQELETQLKEARVSFSISDIKDDNDMVKDR